MQERGNIAFLTLLVILCAAGAIVRTNSVQMDTDKNGRVSKQEFMKFMEAEFDRLDKDKSGELDVKELSQSKVQVSRFASVGK